MNDDRFYNYKVWTHGNCCQCGTALKENEGLFLCDKCKELNEKYYKEHKKRRSENVSK